MSAFALLSRSTRFKKAKDTARYTHNQKISRNEAESRSSVGDSDKANGATRKRKRDSEGLSTDQFFGIRHAGTSAQIDKNVTNAERSPTASIAGTGVGDENERMNEDECRQILRSHKLKITQLWDPNTASMNGSVTNSTKCKRKAALSEKDDERRKRPKLNIIPQPLTSFTQLRSRYALPTTLLINLDAQGYAVPTEVQLGSLPLLLDDENAIAGNRSESTQYARQQRRSLPSCNLLTVAPTGSGKTLAFLLPMINAIMQQRAKSDNERSVQDETETARGPLAIALAPTKELVRQIVNEGRKLARMTGIKISAVRKGTTLHHDTNATNESSENESGAEDNKKDSSASQSVTKSHVLVSTPSAMLNAALGPDGTPDLATVTNLVFDEADVLLDPLFRDETMRVWDACSNTDLRLSLWSATMGSNIEELSVQKLRARSEKGKSSARSAPLHRLVVGLKDSSIPNIEHRLIYAATEQGKLLGIRQLLHTSQAASATSAGIRPPFLIFTQTIPRAIALHSELLYDIPRGAGRVPRIAVLHADLSDTARERVMTSLRKGEIWVLITTDLLARGVDFKGINGVINYDLPNSSAAYVHRVGRTGRAGREGGVAITFYGKDDLPYVKNVANVIAATERQKGGAGANSISRQWLFESLPKVSKQDKLKLKKRGVESRRTRRLKDEAGTSRNTKTTISTKSGFERQLEHRRKAAAVGSRGAGVADGVDSVGEDDEGDFSGFED